ncbi:MAG: hypothetical protein WDA10_10680 [Porticoccaceae bacterium]|nr:hypothetical protein [Porticoccaceae bacterium]
MIKRRQLLKATLLGGAALPLLATAPGQAADITNTGESTTERNKRLLRERYRAAQREALPATLPGARDQPPPPKADPSTVLSAQAPPGGVDQPEATIAAIAPWHAQTVSPGFTAYGPMIAAGDAVVEEWETFFHGADGTLYNNQYCWIKQFVDGEVVRVREYLDSHHAFVVLGQAAPWKALAPPTGPRRRWVPMGPPRSERDDNGREEAFPIARRYSLPPQQWRDPRPTAAAPRGAAGDPAANRALVAALHEARARNDSAAVDRCHGPGFRHFIAGEGPLGWDHLPLEELYAPLVAHLASPIEVWVSEAVAEGDSVFEELEIFARLDDGTVYHNWHCCIHVIRDGGIVQTREYLDTHHLWVVLGRWADWGKTPVAPLTRARRSNLPWIDETFQGRNPFLDLARWKPLPPP